MSASDSVHVTLTIGPPSQGSRARLIVGGVDLTRHCRVCTVYARAGAITDVWLNLIGVTLDIEADVARDRVQALTYEEVDARTRAGKRRDIERGARTYGGHVPTVNLDVSLGQVEP
jgi:hypothetical protein